MYALQEVFGRGRRPGADVHRAMCRVQCADLRARASRVELESSIF